MSPKERKYLYCPRCDMNVGHDLNDGCYVCNVCGFPNIVLMDAPSSQKCPDCGKATYQHLRGWKRGYYVSYRCGHCNKAYKVTSTLLGVIAAREDREDVVKSSQLGFKVSEKTAGGSWHYGDKLCLLCKRPAYPTAYYPPDFITTNNILVIPLCQHHKGAYMAHGLKRLDTMYLKDKVEEAEG